MPRGHCNNFIRMHLKLRVILEDADWLGMQNYVKLFLVALSAKMHDWICHLRIKAQMIV